MRAIFSFMRVSENSLRTRYRATCSHPCAGAMLIFSVCFQFYMVAEAKKFTYPVLDVYKWIGCYDLLGLSDVRHCCCLSVESNCHSSDLYTNCNWK